MNGRRLDLPAFCPVYDKVTKGNWQSHQQSLNKGMHIGKECNYGWQDNRDSSVYDVAYLGIRVKLSLGSEEPYDQLAVLALKNCVSAVHRINPRLACRFALTASDSRLLLLISSASLATLM